jgi:hypothetical protein
MSIHVSRAIVRFAAAATALACGYCLSFMAAALYGEFCRQSGMRGNHMLLFGVWSVLPILSIGESVRAWRYVPKGIESLSLIWIIPGVGGVSYGLFLCFVDGKVLDVIIGVIGLCLLVCALWMTKQQRRLRDVA